MAAEGDAPHIMLVAGESSGDLLGAKLMAALKERSGPYRFTGVGGEAMEAEGLASIFPMPDIAVMGPREVIPRLPLILRRMALTVSRALAEEPDLIVIIDSPDFTHFVARFVKYRKPWIPIVDYVSPTVWAWRRGRANAMAHYLDRVMAVLPFEPAFFEAKAGLACDYVGHPGIEKLPPQGAGADFRTRHGIAPEAPLLCVLPGSRTNEVIRLTRIFGGAVERLHAALPTLRLVLPTVPHVRETVASQVADWPVQPVLTEGEGEKLAAFDASTAALAASGTVSLELGLSGVPMVIAYKLDPVAAFLAGRMLKVPSVVLVNLILDRPAVQEFLQSRCTPEALAEAMLPLLTDTPARSTMLADLAEFAERMGVGGAPPSHRAAAVVEAMLAESRRKRLAPPREKALLT